MSKTTEPKPKRSGTKWLLGSVLGVVVVVGVLYVVGYFVAGNQLPKDAAVAGVRLGGLSPAQAAEKLESDLAPARAQTITLNGPDGTSAQIVPAEAGLSLDVEASVKAAGGGFSWNPTDIIDNLFGGNPDAAPVALVDEQQLDAALAAAAPSFAVEPVAATLDIATGEIERTESVRGMALDVDASAAAVIAAYQAGEAQAEAAVTLTDPEITTEMVDKAVAEFAEPLLSGSVVFTSDDGKMKVSAKKLAKAASFEVKDGALVGSLDAKALLKSTSKEQKKLKLNSPKDASYKFKDGKPVVVPSVTGEVIDEKAFAEALPTLALSKDKAARTAEIALIIEEPEFDTDAATKVKPREVIGEFTTYYPHASTDYRNKNLGRAAEMVNGTVVMPGEIFSLDKTLGPRTPSNGYMDGYVIDGGILVKASGGGISQSATTMYNAAFFAGYEDVEHKPHSLYFDRYPAGRESTIMSGAFDMRFRNDTEYPAIIQGYIHRSSWDNKGSITFKVWSIPTWDKVTSSEIKKSGFYSGGTKTIPYGQTCEPQSAIQGFTATYSRLFWKDGEVVKKQNYSWKYSAGDRIICAPKPQPKTTEPKKEESKNED